MASDTKWHHFNSNFGEILNNLDLTLITPFLTEVNIVSFGDQVDWEKKDKKSAVKSIINHVKSHPNGDLLFKRCLEKSMHQSQRHQNLLTLLYSKDKGWNDILTVISFVYSFKF